MVHPALWLYSALTWALQPLVRRKLRRRAKAEPGYGLRVEERFGIYPPQTDSLMPETLADPWGRFVWIHAVSLGETRAAAILLTQLRRCIPGMRLLLTHGTATGMAEGEKLLQPGDVQVWQPWDTPVAVRRFLRQFRPAIGILMETEVWPNLVSACHHRQVPLVLANARLNDKSYARAKRLAWLARPAYAALQAVWAQTQADAQRLRALGAAVQGVFGNLKFDVVPDPAQLLLGRQWRSQGGRPVVMLASSREGEEQMWLQAIQSAQRIRAVQWLIVPRHPQRFDEVARLLQMAGLRVSRRSQWLARPEGADVWLGDSIGEMALYYALADVVLLGGSFAPLGGQNLIEATACHCPVVLGPHTFNFAEAAQLACSAGAAQRVADLSQGVQQACSLALDGPRLAQAKQTAAQFAAAHRGAAQATALAIAQLLRDAQTPAGRAKPLV